MLRVAVALVLLFAFAGVALGESRATPSVIEVVSPGTPVVAEPSARSRRIGTLASGTRLLALGDRVPHETCDEGFVRVERGFLCARHVRPSSLPPHAVQLPAMREGALLPYRYAFVKIDGTLAHRRAEDYFEGVGAFALGKGYGVVVKGEVEHFGRRFIQLRDGHLVSADAVARVRGSDFEGVEIAPGEPFDVAFAKKPGALVKDAAGRTLRRLGRREVVRVEAVEPRRVRLRDGGFVDRDDLHLPRLLPPPEGVFAGEIFVDVDLAEQTLVVYRGARPIFATLVSTGRGGKQSETREGVFPIWAKLAATDMRDVHRTDVVRNYFIENVPWVQFFDGAIALHAAFWHDDFGRPRSHGCVNLSPKDARRVFELTRPVLPPGWEAILVDPEDRPTLVRVHR